MFKLFLLGVCSSVNSIGGIAGFGDCLDMPSMVVGVCARCGRPLFEPPPYEEPSSDRVVAAHSCGHVYHEDCYQRHFRIRGVSPRDPVQLVCCDPVCDRRITSNEYSPIRAERIVVSLDTTGAYNDERVRHLESQLQSYRDEVEDLRVRLTNSQFTERILASKLELSNAAADAWHGDYSRLCETIRQHNPELINIHYQRPRVMIHAPDIVPAPSSTDNSGIGCVQPSSSNPGPLPDFAQPSSSNPGPLPDFRSAIRDVTGVPPDVNPFSTNDLREIDRQIPSAPDQRANRAYQAGEERLQSAKEARTSSLRISNPFNSKEMGNLSTAEVKRELDSDAMPCSSKNSTTMPKFSIGRHHQSSRRSSRESAPSSSRRTIEKKKSKLTERLEKVRRARVTPPRPLRDETLSQRTGRRPQKDAVNERQLATAIEMSMETDSETSPNRAIAPATPLLPIVSNTQTVEEPNGAPLMLSSVPISRGAIGNLPPVRNVLDIEREMIAGAIHINQQETITNLRRQNLHLLQQLMAENTRATSNLSTFQVLPADGQDRSAQIREKIDNLFGDRGSSSTSAVSRTQRRPALSPVPIMPPEPPSTDQRPSTSSRRPKSPSRSSRKGTKRARTPENEHRSVLQRNATDTDDDRQPAYGPSHNYLQFTPRANDVLPFTDIRETRHGMTRVREGSDRFYFVNRWMLVGGGLAAAIVSLSEQRLRSRAEFDLHSPLLYMRLPMEILIHAVRRRRHMPASVVLSVGSEEVQDGTSTETIEERLDELIRELSRRGVVNIVAIPPVISPNFQALWTVVDARLRSLVPPHGVVFDYLHEFGPFIGAFDPPVLDRGAYRYSASNTASFRRRLLWALWMRMEPEDDGEDHH
ncbi:hypothetical protein U1Q18_044196 [Sarracenia purpurea var. burkii]